jgi:hypothetical protein
MASKADFNAEEWSTIAQGPVIAGLMVVASDRGGTVRESLSMAKAYGEAKRAAPGSLVAELASEPPRPDPEKFGSAEELPVRGPDLISQAVAALQAHATPEEVDEYKRFCLDVAEHAAEATKSGGFLGIGGKRISQAESQALDSVAATLGIKRASAGPAPSEGG